MEQPRRSAPLQDVCAQACVVHPSYPCEVATRWSAVLDMVASCPHPFDEPIPPHMAASRCTDGTFGALRSTRSNTLWQGPTGWLAEVARHAKGGRQPLRLQQPTPGAPLPMRGRHGMPAAVPCRNTTELDGARGILIQSRLCGGRGNHDQQKVDALCRVLRANPQLQFCGDETSNWDCRTTDNAPLWQCLLSGPEGGRRLGDVWLGHTRRDEHAPDVP